MKLSARNQFKGKVVEIKEGAVNASVKIEIAKDVVISSTISSSSPASSEITISGISSSGVLSVSKIGITSSKTGMSSFFSSRIAFLERKFWRSHHCSEFL